MAKSHDAELKKIDELAKRLDLAGTGRKLELVYMIPLTTDCLTKFALDPVNPLAKATQEIRERVSVRVAAVRRPA